MASTQIIQAHLDDAALHGGYLDAINGTTPESLIDAQMKMESFWDALGESDSSGKPVLSIGVGQGEEVHALATNQTTRIVGLDISESALTRARERAAQHKYGASLTEADARRLPFRHGSFSGVVMSAVLHEVFSYCEPNGFEAFQASIGEASRCIEPGGVLYVREFSSPASIGRLALRPESEEAAAFYNFFTGAFRVGLAARRLGDHIEVGTDGSLASAGDVTQVLLHFRNFWNDHAKGYTDIGDTSWKELRESYVIPNPDPAHADQYLDPEQFCAEVVKAAGDAGQTLELIKLNLVSRRKTNMFLRQHFRVINGEEQDITDSFLQKATSKLEALFRKRR